MDSETLWSLAFTWAPILLMIGFWVYFMPRLRGGRQKGYFDQHIEFMERQNELLERIATALERRNG